MEVSINRDTRSYKVKDIGPFSLREIGGLILIAIGCYGVHFIVKEITGETNIYLMMIGAIPGALIGFVRPYGISFEKFVKTIFVENFLNPKIRKYESDTIYNLEDFLTQEELEEYISTENQKPKKMTKEEKRLYKGYK